MKRLAAWVILVTVGMTLAGCFVEGDGGGRGGGYGHGGYGYGHGGYGYGQHHYYRNDYYH